MRFVIPPPITPIPGSVMRVASDAQIADLGVLVQQCEAGVGVPAHRHGFAEILMVVSGSASLTVGDERRVLNAGDAVVVSAGQVHAFETVGDESLVVAGAFGAAELITEVVHPSQ